MINPSKINLSIIVPTFNEEGGIRQTVSEIYQDLGRLSLKKIIDSFEVLVVDDGSWDKTADILKVLKKKYNFKLIKHRSNLGLGASIITGIQHSTEEYITYLPADGQVFLREITSGLKRAPYADLILTYRGERIDYNPYRRILSNTLTITMKLLFGLNYKDYNWVHIYKRDLFNYIKTKSKGVFYLGEIVARTHQAGFKILEAEVKYHPRSTGYSKNARLPVVFTTLRDLIKLWVELKIRPLLP